MCVGTGTRTSSPCPIPSERRIPESPIRPAAKLIANRVPIRSANACSYSAIAAPWIIVLGRTRWRSATWQSAAVVVPPRRARCRPGRQGLLLRTTPKESTATALEVVVDELADPLRRAERDAAPAGAQDVLNATIRFEDAVAG